MNGWKGAVINALIAGLAAFGGLQIGVAKSETRAEALIRYQDAQDEAFSRYQLAQDARMDRMEAKLDWLIAHERRR